MEGVGLRLDDLLPSRRWVLLMADPDTDGRVRRWLWGDEPAGVQVVTTATPAWERRLQGLGPQEGILVGLPPAGWSRCARALQAARLHPGPLVMLGGDGDDSLDGVALGTQLHLATADGPVRAVVFHSHRDALKSSDPGMGRHLARLRVSNRSAADAQPPSVLVDLARTSPVGRRPGALDPYRTDVEDLGSALEEIRGRTRLPRYLEITTRRADLDDGVARPMVELAALGVPVRLPVDATGPPGVAPSVLAEMRDARELDLWDPRVQELASVRLRRATMLAHGRAWEDDPRGTESPPHRVAVSVLLASNRADRIAEAVGRVTAQHHRPLEVVVAAHGIDVALHDTPSDVPVTVVPVPTTATLGHALQAATEAASGDVVVKMDDDDLYAPSHVTDLVLALRFSGATVVGKAAEFVHLGGLDVTVRRGLVSERFGGHVAGGTLALHTSDLADVDGWTPVPRAVDTRLLHAVHRAGGSVYRTHGFGFILNRHGRGHTYEVGDARYLARTVDQRAGLDLDFAGVSERTVPDVG
jgi:hypothetical protein